MLSLTCQFFTQSVSDFLMGASALLVNLIQQFDRRRLITDLDIGSSQI